MEIGWFCWNSAEISPCPLVRPQKIKRDKCFPDSLWTCAVPRVSLLGRMVKGPCNCGSLRHSCFFPPVLPVVNGSSLLLFGPELPPKICCISRFILYHPQANGSSHCFTLPSPMRQNHLGWKRPQDHRVHLNSRALNGTFIPTPKYLPRRTPEEVR